MACVRAISVEKLLRDLTAFVFNLRAEMAVEAFMQIYLDHLVRNSTASPLSAFSADSVRSYSRSTSLKPTAAACLLGSIVTSTTMLSARGAARGVIFVTAHERPIASCFLSH